MSCSLILTCGGALWLPAAVYGCPADRPGAPRRRNPWHTGGVCCPVCFWEDDGVQFRWPAMSGGANKVSLVEAQRNYQDFGACDEHGRRYVRPPADDEPLDPAWRPIDLARDSFEDWSAEERAPWPDDRLVLCWWLPTFWRRDHSAS
ncbi:CPCC family cysteine-rich protein [Streptomyces griseofuscus]|uniref:CPCC family cysteine-rich protein n=1 Tax=Streptomyces griseofuscus TaxID=146922 RepID=UPI0033F449F8